MQRCFAWRYIILLCPLLVALGAHEVGVMSTIERLAVVAEDLSLIGVLGFHS